jgi:hypothetical protein
MASDLRRYACQTILRLVAGFLLILFVIGDGLIWWLYGREAALLGVVCLAAGLAPLILIALFLWLLDIVVQRNRDR